MSVCTFFGHRTVPKGIELYLRSIIIDLIEKHNVTLFYVGNHGDFDLMVHKVLKELSVKYSITYYVVLAYYPYRNSILSSSDYSDTILPENIENVPKRFAIPYCNKWMINKSEYVVTYVTHSIASGAARFKDLAEKRGKTVININHY